MEDNDREQRLVFRSRLDSSGRIVLPREVRERLKLSTGDGVMMVADGDHYILETPQMALKDAQAYFKSLVPSGTSVVDELLAERRQEAARE